ncbi:MAG: hypothetical protein ABH986_05130 [archaeon]
MKLQETKRPDGKPVYSIVLPKAVVKAKGFKKGQELKAVFNEKGNIELTG